MQLYAPNLSPCRDQVHALVVPPTAITKRYIVGLRHGRNLPTFRVSFDIDNIGLQDVHGLMDQKFPVAPLMSLVLTRGDGDSSLPSEIRKEPRVVSIDRLLEPFNSIGLNAF